MPSLSYFYAIYAILIAPRDYAYVTMITMMSDDAMMLRWKSAHDDADDADAIIEAERRHAMMRAWWHERWCLPMMLRDDVEDGS